MDPLGRSEGYAMISEGPMPHLTTSRLHLRDLREEDIDLLVQYFSEPDSREHILRHQRDSKGMASYFETLVAYARETSWADRSTALVAVSGATRVT